MIGIFDSGVGGLTVVKQVFTALPTCQVVYFGDTARVPYGNKSVAMVRKYARQDTEFLLHQGVKIVVIACHTVSAVAADFLREKFPMVTIFDVVGPGLDRALALTNSKKIGIIGTENTVKSQAHQKYLQKINPAVEVFYQACPLFVPLVEEGWLDRPETRKIARYYLNPLKRAGIDTLVLACTHYPLLEEVIKKVIGKRIRIVDPAQEVALEIKRYLSAKTEVEKGLVKNSPPHRFYLSDLTAKFPIISQRVLGRVVKVEQVEVEK